MNKLVTLRPQTLLRQAAAMALASCALVVGCTQVVTTEQRELAPEPELTLTFENAATQPVRDFDRSTALYANGDIVTDSTGARYRTREDTNVYLLPVVETGVFLANVATAPVTIYQQRQGVLSSGPQLPATHTAMPVLPPRRDQPPADVQPDTTPTIEPGEPLPPPGMEPSVSTPLPADTTDTTTAPAADIAPVAPAAVTLTPAAELSTNAFAIVGGVTAPGRYEAQEGLTLAEAVLAAGVGEADRSSVSVSIERTGEVPSSATLAEILSGQTANPTLLAGDVITVSVNQ